MRGQREWKSSAVKSLQQSGQNEQTRRAKLEPVGVGAQGRGTGCTRLQRLTLPLRRPSAATRLLHLGLQAPRPREPRGQGSCRRRYHRQQKLHQLEKTLSYYLGKSLSQMFPLRRGYLLLPLTFLSLVGFNLNPPLLRRLRPRLRLVCLALLLALALALDLALLLLPFTAAPGGEGGLQSPEYCSVAFVSFREGIKAAAWAGPLDCSYTGRKLG